MKSKAKNANVDRARITSFDLSRGLVMVIMALDHVRMYFGLGTWYSSPTDLATTSSVLLLHRPHLLDPRTGNDDAYLYRLGLARIHPVGAALSVRTPRQLRLWSRDGIPHLGSRSRFVVSVLQVVPKVEGQQSRKMVVELSVMLLFFIIAESPRVDRGHSYHGVWGSP